MTPQIGPVSVPPFEPTRRRSTRRFRPLASYREWVKKCQEPLLNVHGWEVELQCPACGVVAMPVYNGWTPSHAIRLGNRPVIYANLNCPTCGADLKQTAGAKLVELFAEVRVPPRNRRRIATFLVVGLLLEAFLMAAVRFFDNRGGLWSLVSTCLLTGQMILLFPFIIWMNSQIALIRHQCECGRPAYKFMGLLGRSGCYRCSSCARLLRLRD